MDFLAPVQDVSARQHAAANPAHSIWVSANAGAGKTKVLIERIGRLLLTQVPAHTILAVTFTKAAAAEIQERLFQKLASWALNDDEILAQELAILTGETHIEADMLKRARRLFAQALEAPGGLKIQTIHAFATALLQKFPLEAGLAPGFSVLTDQDTKRTQKRALAQARQNEPEAFQQLSGFLRPDVILEKMSQAAQMLGESPVVTGQMDGAVKADIEAGLDNAFGLPKGFSIVAALKGVIGNHRVALSNGLAALQSSKKGLKPTDQTFADFLTAILEADLSSLDESGAIAIIGLWYKIIFTTDHAFRKTIVTIAFKDDPAITQLLGADKDGPLFDIVPLVDDFMAHHALAYCRPLNIGARATFGAYQRIKKENNSLDFADLVARAQALLSHQDGAALWVLFKLDGGISHILLDEAQDTNQAQWGIIRPLSQLIDEMEKDAPRTTFVVGDKKQSIYSFQGADASVFQAEHGRFLSGPVGEYAPERRGLQFEHSFRTGQKILDFVDHVWAASMADIGQKAGVAPEIKGGTPNENLDSEIVQHIAFFEEQHAQVEIWDIEPAMAVPKPEELPKELEVGATSGRALGPLAHLDPSEVLPLDKENNLNARHGLAQRVALEIKARIGTQTVWEKNGNVRPLKPHDVMVLVRARDGFFNALIRRLKGLGVPIAGTDRITLSKELAVMDLLAIGRFALNPRDDFSLACVLRGPFCNLVNDDENLFPLAFRRGEETLYERLSARAHERALWKDAHHLLERAIALAGVLNPYEFYAHLLEDKMENGQSGWDMLLARMGQVAKEPVEVFLNRAMDHGTNKAPGLANFIAEIQGDDTSIKREVSQESGEEGDSDGGVRVMTVHGAKGLEAPLVIMPDILKTSNERGSLGLLQKETGLILAGSPKALPFAKEYKGKAIEALKNAKNLAAMAESARLLYVGITRARDCLVLCGHEGGKVGKDNNQLCEIDGQWMKISTKYANTKDENLDVNEEAPSKNQNEGQDVSHEEGKEGKDNVSSIWFPWVQGGLAKFKKNQPARKISLATVAGRPALYAEAYGQLLPLSDGASPDAKKIAAGPAPMVSDPPANVQIDLDLNAPTKEDGSAFDEIGPLRRLSPSSLLGQAAPISLSPLASKANAARFAKGRHTHALLHILAPLPPRHRQQKAAQYLSQQDDVDQALAKDIIGAVMGVFERPELADLFQSNSRGEVHIAGKLPGFGPQTIVAGSMDRLVITDDLVMVVDFKTDKNVPANANEVPQAYLVQMGAYCALLKQQWPRRKIAARLLYTENCQILDLPEARLNQALDSLPVAKG